MTEIELRNFARDCYAALCATMPPVSSSAWAIWAEMCADVPLKAAPFIRSKIIALDAMPRNFGKTVQGYFRDWRVESGEPAPAQKGCGMCDTRSPGFFTVWGKNGARVLCVCRCNTDQTLPPGSRRSPGEMVDLGYIVRPMSFRGSFLDFEREQFGVGTSGGNIGSMAQRLALAPVGEAPPRQSHKAYMDYAECPF